MLFLGFCQVQKRTIPYQSVNQSVYGTSVRAWVPGGLGMKFTRRKIVGGAGALGTLAAFGGRPAFAQAAGPVRVALTEFVRDTARGASLRKGVATMKARSASDPKSWFFQAAVHAYDDALYADALSRDASVAKVDR